MEDIIEEMLEAAKEPYEERKKECRYFDYQGLGIYGLMINRLYEGNCYAHKEYYGLCSDFCEHGECPFGKAPLKERVTITLVRE